jgi:hypothetical protein
MSNKTVEELVDMAKKPGTFNILNVLNERAYPHENVSVYLDEQTAYDAARLNEKIKELTKISSDQDKIDELTVKRDEKISSLESSKYVFKIVGISEGLRDDLREQAEEKYPMEYEDETNPFTGQVTKTQVENVERNKFFTMLLWHESISKIINPDGDVQENVTMEDVVALRKTLPIAAIGAITESIEKLRMSTAVFMATVEEDFLAKS